MSLPPMKCRCGETLTPHWVQREGDHHAATPVPPHVSGAQFPVPARGADPLVWGESADAIERWADGQYPTPHDLVNRRGQTICHGNCAPTNVPDPFRLPITHVQAYPAMYARAVETAAAWVDWNDLARQVLEGRCVIVPQPAEEQPL